MVILDSITLEPYPTGIVVSAPVAELVAPPQLKGVRPPTRASRRDLDRQFVDSTVHALGLMRDMGRDADFVEAVAAFREHRAPEFPGLDPDRRFDSELGYKI